MSKNDAKYIDGWMKENTDRVVIRPRKHERLPERIELAINAGYAPSKQAYIINAVKAALERDGIPEIPDIPD